MSKRRVRVVSFSNERILARFVDQDWDGGFGGTAIYSAPEVVNEIKLEPASRSISGGYSPAVDLWGAGVLLFVFLAGDFPMSEDDVWEADVCEITKKAIRDLEAREGSSIPRRLLDGLLAADPAARFDASTALQDPWLTSAPGGKAAFSYDAALAKSSASKESAAYLEEALRGTFNDPDLTPSCRTVPMTDVHYYSTTMMETSASKSTYSGDANHKGPWQTPRKDEREEEFGEAEQTPTYVPDGRKPYRGASVSV